MNQQIEETRNLIYKNRRYKKLFRFLRIVIIGIILMSCTTILNFLKGKKYKKNSQNAQNNSEEAGLLIDVVFLVIIGIIFVLISVGYSKYK